MKGSPPPAPPSGPALVLSALVFYALSVGLAVLLLSAQDLSLRDAVFGPLPPHQPPWRAALAGTGAGLAVVMVGLPLQRFAFYRDMLRHLRELLGRPGTTTIIVLSLLSAVAEEILFRGALQPLLGLAPTAVLFGFLHGGLSRSLWTWTAWATVMGFVLGGLAAWTESLLGPMLCHLTVNFLNMHLLAADAAPNPLDGPRP